VRGNRDPLVARHISLYAAVALLILCGPGTQLGPWDSCLFVGLLGASTGKSNAVYWFEVGAHIFILLFAVIWTISASMA
jgi:hypothetical protein